VVVIRERERERERVWEIGMEEVAGATTQISERWMTEAIKETINFRIRTSREEVTKDRAIRGRIIKGEGQQKSRARLQRLWILGRISVKAAVPRAKK
jgi:hypothetical protein